MVEYENYKNPTEREIRAMRQRFKATTTMKHIIKEMKRDYSGFTGYGKVYCGGDNYPKVG